METRELHAPKWLHRFIIGRKGQNIKKITQDFDNKVPVLMILIIILDCIFLVKPEFRCTSRIFFKFFFAD